MSIGWVLVWGVVMGISIATGEEACPESICTVSVFFNLGFPVSPRPGPLSPSCNALARRLSPTSEPPGGAED